MDLLPTQAERDNLHELLALARREDLGPKGDLTSRLLPENMTATAEFRARNAMTLAGACFLAEIAEAYDPAIRTDLLAGDGHAVRPGQAVARWTGPARAVLSAERVALNFLQRLSGVATATRRYVDAVRGTSASIFDTRKTTPGWRELEKYAVRAGGGQNHRRGLYDAVLVKDNHLAARNSKLAEIGPELDALRKELGPRGFIQVEVDTLEQLADALTLPIDIVLLDNMPPETLRRAVAMRDQAAPSIELEASGGITLQTVRAAAETGVDRISVGALTHSAPAVDLGLDIDLNPSR